MSFNFDIWSLIPSAVGMVCSTGLGTVLGNIAKEYTKDSKKYEKLAAGVSAYFLSGYLADKCSEKVSGQMNSMKLTYEQIKKLKAQAAIDDLDDEDEDYEEDD